MQIHMKKTFADLLKAPSGLVSEAQKKFAGMLDKLKTVWYSTFCAPAAHPESRDSDGLDERGLQRVNAAVSSNVVLLCIR